jgi:hypothetical protein
MWRSGASCDGHRAGGFEFLPEPGSLALLDRIAAFGNQLAAFVCQLSRFGEP